MSLVDHVCQQNTHRYIQVLYGPSLDPDWKHWIMRFSRFANRTDIDDGAAETVGDLLCQHEFIISFCPFCGVKLRENDAAVTLP
jgi:hypothetical protein